MTHNFMKIYLNFFKSKMMGFILLLEISIIYNLTNQFVNKNE